ncbi:MAG: hypothetical protein ACP5IT_11225 [Thermoproteota archaeon]
MNLLVPVVAYKLPPFLAFTVVLSTATLSMLSLPVEYPLATRASSTFDQTPSTLQRLNLSQAVL